jgi:hypothetical protein
MSCSTELHRNESAIDTERINMTERGLPLRRRMTPNWSEPSKSGLCKSMHAIHPVNFSYDRYYPRCYWLPAPDLGLWRPGADVIVEAP